MNLTVDINGIKLKNPVLTASGTFGYAAEYKEFVDLDQLGGIILKGLSLYPSRGNPSPRIVETPAGLLNAVGLENVGIEAFIKDKLPFLRTVKTKIFVNIYGKSVEEYEALAAIIDNLPEISGIEVNISCPNVEAGGAAFGKDPDAAFRVVSRVRKSTSKHLMVKLSPNVSDIGRIAVSVEKAGADAISLINTLTGLAVDIDTFKPVLANVTGGLSGPAVKPVALRMVWEAAQQVDIPVIGIGGITDAADALEFIVAGATAVQVGTASLVDPSALAKIVDGIRKFLVKRNIDRVSDIVGSLTT